MRDQRKYSEDTCPVLSFPEASLRQVDGQHDLNSTFLSKHNKSFGDFLMHPFVPRQGTMLRALVLA